MQGFAKADWNADANPALYCKKVFHFLPAYGRLNKVIKQCSRIDMLQRRGYE